ncbi:MAG: outer membrane protein assembly factor BamD [Desulfobacter sp.]|nr:MAG: outer membrane protein assembly factor BamD [Desulfobacter sp.]|eukprot:Anaeramoba_ignava/a615049_15.p1 GENE.a615049_15~~a615049_15.p1  ORF type:complete len:229 (+),score=-12.99 a615049_15:574-1260(+)
MKNWLIIGIFMILLSGCSLFDESSQMNKSAQQLAAEGAAAFMNEDYQDAVKAYTDLKDWYPFSKYAILAELKVADAHFHLEEYDEALVAYEGFEKMHPKNEAVPYVINQMGMCWFKQIDTVDRDSAPAKNAMALFKRLYRQFPDHELAEEAVARIEACIDNIAGHELYVADHYNKTEAYKAALKRYEYIVEFYPGTEQSEIALAKIPAVAEKVKKLEAEQAEKEKNED